MARPFFMFSQRHPSETIGVGEDKGPKVTYEKRSYGDCHAEVYEISQVALQKVVERKGVSHEDSRPQERETPKYPDHQ